MFSVVKDVWRIEEVTCVTELPQMTERRHVHDNEAYLCRLQLDLLQIQNLQITTSAMCHNGKLCNLLLCVFIVIQLFN